MCNKGVSCAPGGIALSLSSEKLSHIEKDIAAAEKELDDDAESIITNERYIYIASVPSNVK